MGMRKANPGRSGEPEVMMEINTTPLIDVMLVLLVMLIITIPVQLHSVNLEMPTSAPLANLIKPAKIQIDIDEKNIVYWQGLPVAVAEIEGKMKSVSSQEPQPEIHIRPDKASQYAVFANVLASSKRQGLSRIAVIGAEQFDQ